jgi:hypothetical protein
MQIAITVLFLLAPTAWDETPLEELLDRMR